MYVDLYCEIKVKILKEGYRWKLVSRWYLGEYRYNIE